MGCFHIWAHKVIDVPYRCFPENLWLWGEGDALVILHLGEYGMLLGLSVPLAGVARFA
jgi:hypothetical protein